MLHLEGSAIKDGLGRTVMLRGVNLGGSSKVPVSPDGATHLSAGFLDHRAVSFVGRPFPLDEADEHFGRLRHWGLTCLRLVVTWEAIEHAGPGEYDEAYLDYLFEVVRRAGEHGFVVFIDPHQDVWSRFTGGDGAPGWTLEAVGFDIGALDQTGAAVTHQMHGDPLPQMIWTTNATKLGAATMFTLFFAGNDFAPKTMIDGEPVQGYLQRHYIEAMRQIAHRLKGLDHVLGYGVMNEPFEGYVGWADLAEARAPVEIGAMPSPFESMLLAAGNPLEVKVWRRGLLGPKIVGHRLINPAGARAWRRDHEPVWRENGVWGCGSDGQPSLLRPDHFSQVDGREVDFLSDYHRPFVNRYARAMRAADPDALIFLGPQPVLEPAPWGPGDAERVIYEPHWYDGYLLFARRFSSFVGVDMLTQRVVLGPRAVRRSFARQLGRLRRYARERMGDVPTLIGETGIPYDLNERKAYRSGDFAAQERAMDRTLAAIEENLLHCTIWNYTADNDNEHGDQWNGEDLSIFSRDQQTDPGDINSGGRALRAVVRPYPRATCGEPLRLSFDARLGIFEYEFLHDPSVTAPTEVFVPKLQYPDACRVEASDGNWELDRANQRLVYRHSDDRSTHRIRITR